MAHTPESPGAAVDPAYAENWDALGALIAAGKSFSGRERNTAFLNLGGTGLSFACASGALNLDQIDDSRSLIPIDWDHDGDLDLWYTNRTGPRLRFLRNDLAGESRWLSLNLEGRACNRDAVGARAELTLRSVDGSERTLWRRLKAGDGFLSQTPKSLHFGFRRDETIQRLVIRWPAPGLPQQVVDGIHADSHWKISEATPAVQVARPTLTLAPGPAQTPEPAAAVRAPLTMRLPVPALEYRDLQGLPTPLTSPHPRPTLVIFWGSWCPLCAAEMKSLAARANELTHLRIIALAVDTAKNDSDSTAVEDVHRALAQRPWPFEAGFASPAIISALARLEARALYPERALALPSAYLIAPDGRLTVIYHGPAGPDQLIKDAVFAATPPSDLKMAVFPFPGRSAQRLFPLHPAGTALALREAGHVDESRAELRRALDASPKDPQARTTLLRHLGDLEDAAGRSEAAADAWSEAVAVTPTDPALRLALGASLWKSGRLDDARAAMDQAGHQIDDPAAFQNQLGKVWQALGEHTRARDAFAVASTRAPDNAEIAFNLAVGHQFTGQTADAITTYEAILDRTQSAAAKTKPAASLDAASNLAWLLATTKDQSLRNPQRALQLASQVNEATHGQSASVLDNLAAAQAANGDFAAATPTAAKALALARATGDTSLAVEIARRLDAYTSGRTWTE